MVKSPESNARQKSLPATLSSLHPADFPVGSVESRAAARALLRPGQLRAGDEGDTEDGGWYIVVKGKGDDPQDPRALVITFPKSLSSEDSQYGKPVRLRAPKPKQALEAESKSGGSPISQ